MTDDEMDEIARLHDLFLFDELNPGRGGLGGLRADLRGVDLAGSDLSDMDLQLADLRGADLRHAHMDNTEFSTADLRGAVLPDDVPVISNIDAAILAAIRAGGRLFMNGWHGPGYPYEEKRKCGTTHCRGGWAVHLAGEAGFALEDKLGTATAAALIYAASRPDKPVPSFYCSDEAAMDDIVACAAEQMGQSNARS